MKLYKVDAVVLSSREMCEADRVLVLYSGNRGKIRVAAHGVNKPSSRKRGAVQPFCYSSFLIYKGKDLDSISQCEAIETFAGLRNDLEKISYASYISELVNALSVEGQPDSKVFSLLLIILHLLSGSDMDVELLTRAFEVKLMEASGFKPYLEGCVYCGAALRSGEVSFCCSAGGVICETCTCNNQVQDVKKYSRGAIEVLRILLEWDFEKLDRLRVSSPIKKDIREIMKDYLNYYSEKNFYSINFWEHLSSYKL